MRYLSLIFLGLLASCTPDLPSGLTVDTYLNGPTTESNPWGGVVVGTYDVDSAKLALSSVQGYSFGDTVRLGFHYSAFMSGVTGAEIKATKDTLIFQWVERGDRGTTITPATGSLQLSTYDYLEADTLIGKVSVDGENRKLTATFKTAVVRPYDDFGKRLKGLEE